MPYLERKGKPRLYYEEDDFSDPWRNTPVLILQHGFGRSSRFWYSWVPYLSRFYKVVRPDLRGLGQSSLDFDLQRNFTVDVLMEDLIAIFDKLGADSVHYCGESFGGLLGMVLAAERPHRIRTLSLVSAPVYISEQSKKMFAFGYSSWQDAMRKMGLKSYAEAVNSAARFPQETDPGLLRWFTEEWSKSNIEVVVAMSHLASQVNVTPHLSRIKAPVLGLYPTSGTLTGQEQEELLRSHVQNFKVVHLASRYHTIQNIAPASCAKQVLHFASQYDGVSCHEL